MGSKWATTSNELSVKAIINNASSNKWNNIKIYISFWLIIIISLLKRNVHWIIYFIPTEVAWTSDVIFLYIYSVVVNNNINKIKTLTAFWIHLQTSQAN